MHSIGSTTIVSGSRVRVELKKLSMMDIAELLHILKNLIKFSPQLLQKQMLVLVVISIRTESLCVPVRFIYFYNRE